MPLNKTAKTLIITAALVALPLTASTAFAGAGEATYNKTCKMCHARGMAGAPKFSDAAAWKDRIAKGMDTLHSHAINGFTGKGMMPPKGGNSKLSDSDVKAAVDYMVEHSK